MERTFNEGQTGPLGTPSGDSTFPFPSGPNRLRRRTGGWRGGWWERLSSGWATGGRSVVQELRGISGDKRDTCPDTIITLPSYLCPGRESCYGPGITCTRVTLESSSGWSGSSGFVATDRPFRDRNEGETRTSWLRRRRRWRLVSPPTRDASPHIPHDLLITLLAPCSHDPTPTYRPWDGTETLGDRPPT